MQMIQDKIKRAWLTDKTAYLTAKFIESLGYSCAIGLKNVITINKVVSERHSNKIVGYMSCLQEFDTIITDSMK